MKFGRNLLRIRLRGTSDGNVQQEADEVELT